MGLIDALAILGAGAAVFGLGWLIGCAYQSACRRLASDDDVIAAASGMDDFSAPEGGQRRG